MTTWITGAITDRDATIPIAAHVIMPRPVTAIGKTRRAAAAIAVTADASTSGPMAAMAGERTSRDMTATGTSRRATTAVAAATARRTSGSTVHPRAMIRTTAASSRVPGTRCGRGSATRRRNAAGNSIVDTTIVTVRIPTATIASGGAAR